MANEIINKFYELKGILKAAEELAATDNQYDHPLLDSMIEKTKQITALIEKNSVGETS